MEVTISGTADEIAAFVVGLQGRRKQEIKLVVGGKGLFRQRKIDRGQSTINEVREKCGLSPVEGGDIRLKKRG